MGSIAKDITKNMVTKTEDNDLAFEMKAVEGDSVHEPKAMVPDSVPETKATIGQKAVESESVVETKATEGDLASEKKAEDSEDGLTPSPKSANNDLVGGNAKTTTPAPTLTPTLTLVDPSTTETQVVDSDDLGPETQVANDNKSLLEWRPMTHDVKLEPIRESSVPKSTSEASSET